jgi:hypothetical protein
VRRRTRRGKEETLRAVVRRNKEKEIRKAEKYLY